MIQPTAADPGDASSESPLGVTTLAEASTGAGGSSDAAEDPPVPQEPTSEAEIEPEPDHVADLPVEIGGQKGPEPTRFGDWEKKGRCTDF